MSHKRMSRMLFKIKVNIERKGWIFPLRNLSGTELVFIVYPHTIALMDWSTLWAVLFFFMVITLGIDSTVSLFIFNATRDRKFTISSVVWNRLSLVYVTNILMSLVEIVPYSSLVC